MSLCISVKVSPSLTRVKVEKKRGKGEGGGGFTYDEGECHPHSEKAPEAPQEDLERQCSGVRVEILRIGGS